MEAIKDQPTSTEPNTTGKSSSKLLRYPLRSATKPKDDVLISPSSKRVRPASNVSQSVSVLDLSASGKEKSAKPPRRLSIPTKSAISPLPRSTGMITPISETRMKRSGPGKDGTPASDVSKSNQRKFNMISSASYWLSQIKLSETASKHSISLGFFKLALESGCEPLQKMRDELKSYVGRHNLAEHGESAKEILRSYNISEDLEELQVSLTCSQVPEDGARSSDEDVQSSSVTGSKNFKPKSLNSESFQESAKKNSSKKTTPAIKSKGSANANSGNLKSVSNVQKNLQKSSNRQETNKVKAKVKGEQKKSDVQKDITDTSADQKSQQEDKENLGIEQVEEISVVK
ncbi:hypothetical protein ACHQM5_008173 [Ranunculus cassubicifolius]